MSETEPLAPAAPPPPPSRRSTRLVAAVVVLIAFVAGVFVGAAGSRLWRFKRPHRMEAKGLRFMSERVLNRLDRELDLDDSQRARIGTILDERTRKIESYWSDIGPKVRREIDATNAEIEKVLTPEQKAKFQKLKMRFFRHRGPPLPPPPPSPRS